MDSTDSYYGGGLVVVIFYIFSIYVWRGWDNDSGSIVAIDAAHARGKVLRVLRMM